MEKRAFKQQALPWVCLWFFSFLTAAFVCVGRVWRGDYQPLTMRYATFGTFCVVALVLLVGTILLHEAADASKRDHWAAWTGTVGGDRIFTWVLGALLGIYFRLNG